jgi:hypothetical protein
VEALESRTLLTLLGLSIDSSPTSPEITAAPPGQLQYTASSGKFDVTDSALLFATDPGHPDNSFAFVGPSTLATPSPLSQIEIFVDTTGSLEHGTTSGVDLLITGKMTVGSKVYDGTLLTGSIVTNPVNNGFGFSNPGDPAAFDFRFTPTGGALLQDYFAGKDVGVSLTIENTTYNGSFTNDFSSNKPKALIGPVDRIPQPVTPTVVTVASESNGGVVGSSVLSDSAVVSGGNNPTGTITFTLKAPDGTTTTVGDPVQVNGDGTYSPTTTVQATEVGTYTWFASYSGDNLNNPAVDDGTNESVTTVKTTPQISTTPTPTSVTLGTTGGVTLKDTAVLSGGYNDGGTITFTLVAPGGATVDTETVTVSGNGSYTTPTGYALPTNSTVTGTYQWNATYSGDVNNSGATDINAANEQATISPASPQITTTPSPTSATLGTTSVTLKDTADLEGGYFPAGTITFTLVAPGGGTVDVETVNVSGNGSYTTPAGYTLPTNSAVTGTYQWNATFTDSSGNNLNASDVNALNEQAAISPASPAINTVAGGSVVIGSGAKLGDVAVLSGGYHPTGTVTFTLYNPSNVAVYTDVVTVSGNGVYTTTTGSNPGGYLPTITGTYLWKATYSGDGNNSVASDNGQNENEVVTPTAPGINTVAAGTVVIGSGAKLSDTAVLAGGFNPTGTITFTLYSPSNVPVYTDTVTVNGNGSYDTSTGTNPGGYLPTATGTYLWSATYSGDVNNVPASDNGQNENEAVSPASPAINTVAGGTVVIGSGAKLGDVAVLSGGYNPGGTITFTLYNPSSVAVYTDVVTVSGNGTYTTSSGSNPGGYLPTATGTYLWKAAYSGDANNSGASDNGQNENETVNSASPGINTVAGGTVVIGSGAKLSDTAVLAGGFNPTGTITFTLYNPSNVAVYTDVVTVSGNGNYDTTTGTNPGGYLPTGTGTYLWKAVYSGDSNNNGASDNGQNENEAVTPAGPAINTVAGGTVVIGSGAKLSDTAVLSGGYNPTGTITFTLFNPSHVAVYTDVVTVSGNGSYDTTTGSNPGGYLPTATGSYLWSATYGGDANNSTATDNGQNENEAVTSASPAINTVAGGSVVIGSGTKLSDTAVLSGGYNPTGTITFTLYSPANVAVYTDVVTVSGNGSYTTATGTNPGGYLPTTTGTYLWKAAYSGDSNNSGAADNGQNENEAVTPAGPAINTVAGGTVVIGSGAKLGDTAVLAGGFNPTGTITFTLFNPSHVAVYTDTVTVSGNGSYDTSTGTNPGGYLPTGTGTYLWSATYGGDSNNSTASDNGQNENEAVTSASPAINTVAGGSVVIGSGTKLSDTAVLSGGFSPTGTITFTLFNPSNVAVYTDVVTVSGNGSYTTASGNNAGGYLPTVTGTYLWSATYSGDSNNSGAHDNGQNENEAVTKASPQISTTPSPTSVTLGTTAVTLKDSAVLSGGYNETGSIVFTLVAPGGSTVDTETVSVNGNGTYTTPTGYTLPTSSTVTGTYQWNAVFTDTSGNNNNASELNDPSERAAVSPASPQITTTPSPTSATLGTSTVTLKDSAVLSGGYSPAGTITFTLIAPGGATVDTETVTVNGNGTYTTPTGYTLPTSSTVTGTYQWNASYTSGNGNNLTASDVNDPSERATISPASPAIVTTPSPTSATLGTSTVTLKDSAVLGGGYSPAGTITFTLVAPGGATVDTETVTVNGNGTYTTPTGYTLPTSSTVTGTYQWNAIYTSGNGNNLTASDINDVSERATISPASPQITTTPSPTSATLGTTTVTLKDSAVLSGGYSPAGTITFTLVAPGGATVDTETVTVNGNGTYTTPTGYTLPTSSTVTGTYQWNAIYTSGNGNNLTASDINDVSERATISPAGPAIVTTPSPTAATLGTTIKDSAVLSGGYSPAGTIVFTLVAPGGATIDTETVTVNGNGTYTTPTGYTLPNSANATGTYQWNATYTSGNGNNLTATDINDVNERVTVTGTPKLNVVKTADVASISAGQTAGYVITITNTGTAVDNNVTLSDPLPPGAGNDINWHIDTSGIGLGAGTTPVDFSINGAVGGQNLVVSPAFISGGDSLAPGQSISVHITGVTTVNDLSFSVNPALGVLGQYAVLFDSGSGNQLSIANDTVSGNIGVYGPGSVQFSGPGSILGRVDFSAANTGQFHNTNGSNVGPSSVNYGVSAVTTARNLEVSLSSGLGGLTGTNLAIGSGNQTVNESAGTLQTYQGVNYRVFNVTSYAMTANNNLTIVGDGSGNPVLFNVAYASNSNINGGVILAGSGLSDDLVMWNFTSSGKNVQMAANAGTFHGVMLLPNDTFTGSEVNIDGRIYGGAGGNMQIVSGTNVNAPPVSSNTLVNTATATATNVPPTSSTATITIVADATFTGSVFCDNNLNGVRDAGEVGDSGAIVTLTNAAHTLTLTRTTDSFGNYTFDNLPAGTYTVTLTTPASGDLFEASHGAVTISNSRTITVNPTDISINNFAEIDTGSLGGTVFLDINDSGVQDSGENGIANVGLSLTGTDYLGNAVSKTTTTDSNGQFTFGNLLPSNAAGYSITESQPAGFLNGIATAGSLGGVASSNSNVIASIVIPGCNNNGTGYNFGELGIFHGLTATIGFWHNQNGQGLLNSFGTTSNGLSLANWLATTFPSLFGKNAPAFNVSSTIGTNLTGRSNSDVAAYFMSLFGVSGQKSYAQVLATAFAVFTTTNSLNTGASGRSLAAKYGFTLSNTGAGAASYAVPQADWAAFGITSSGGATQSIASLLQLANKYAVKGVLNNNNTTQINETNDVFNAINNQGDIGAGMALITSGTSGAVMTDSIGHLYAGTYLVAVDGLSGDLGVAEQARIDDAIADLNASAARFGVVLADAPADLAGSADIQIHLSDTSVIGGKDQGVLGVTQTGGNITIIDNWNYYVGSDISAVGANQYDFQTVVTHEIGHALGLGHSSDVNSVMYPELDTGTARRDLTANDLAAIDNDGGAPQALHAGGKHQKHHSASKPASGSSLAVPPGLFSRVALQIKSDDGDAVLLKKFKAGKWF